MASLCNVAPARPETQTGPRGGPASGRTDLQPSTRNTWEMLIKCVQDLATDRTTGTLLERIEKLPDLEAEIKHKDEKLRALEIEIKQTQSSHEEDRLQSLNTYNIDRDKIKARLGKVQAQLTAVGVELAQKETAIEQLRSAEESRVTKIKNLERLIEVRNQEAKEVSRRIEEANGAAQALKKANESLEIDLKQKQDQIVQTEGNMKRLQDATEKWEKRAKVAEHQLETAKNLTVPLVDEIPTPAMGKLDRLWRDASSMVCSIFFENMSENVLKHDIWWSRWRSESNWSSTLPMPRSNSHAAKQMRCAAILGSLARSFAHHLFQPTYLLRNGSDFRSLLTRQAHDESEKEANLRAIILAYLPKEQGAVTSEAVARACEDVTKLTSGVLPPNNDADWRRGLEGVAEEACDIWGEIRRSIFAIEPSFLLRLDPGRNWDQWRTEAGQPLVEQQEQVAGNSQDEAMFAVFPRLYSWDEDGSFAETNGVVFMKSQAQAAREEEEGSLRSPRQRRSSPERSRSFRDRKSSREGTSSQTTPKAQAFLGGQS